MKKLNNYFLLIAAILITGQAVQAQTIVVPEKLEGWSQNWVANLNGSQATYNNWSEGGVNTVSGAASTVYSRLFREKRTTFGFRTNLRYGLSVVAGEERKSDDLISLRLRSTYDLQKDSKIAAYGALHFRTQFADGYDYDKGVNESDSLISGFLAPAYFSESVGLEYNASSKLQLALGLGLKQTYISDGDLAPNYGLALGENFRSEGGLSTSISFQTNLAENILYSSNLETFTNFLIAINKTDVFWSNEITGKINSLINASFQYEMRYDDDFSSKVQIKQVLAAGVSFNLF